MSSGELGMGAAVGKIGAGGIEGAHPARARRLVQRISRRFMPARDLECGVKLQDGLVFVSTKRAARCNTQRGLSDKHLRA